MKTPINADQARDQIDAILWEIEQEGSRNNRRARRMRQALTVIDPEGEWNEEKDQKR